MPLYNEVVFVCLHLLYLEKKKRYVREFSFIHILPGDSLLY